MKLTKQLILIADPVFRGVYHGKKAHQGMYNMKNKLSFNAY